MKRVMPLLLLATGCGLATQNASESDVKIYAGSTVQNNVTDERLLSTVALTTLAHAEKNHSFCTGTIYSRRAIVTAAHCLVDENKKLVTEGDLYVSFGNQVSPQSLKIRVARRIPHPQYDAKLNLTANPSRPPHDIGILILERDIPAPYRNVDILEAPLEKNQSFVAVGFGVSNNRNVNDTGVMRQSELNLRAEEGVAHRFVTRNLFAGTCAGDSGGPAYVHRNGRYFFAGITSTGIEISGDCFLGQNSFTDARYYLQWVRANIGNAPAPAPVPQPPPVVIPLPPTGGTQCRLQEQPRFSVQDANSPQAWTSVNGVFKSRLLFRDVNKMLSFVPEYNGVIYNPWTNECEGGTLTGTASCDLTRKRIVVWRALQANRYVLFSTDNETFYARDSFGRLSVVVRLADLMPSVPAPLTMNTPTQAATNTLAAKLRGMYPGCTQF